MTVINTSLEQFDLNGDFRLRKSTGELAILLLLGILGVFTVVYSQLNLPIENPFGAGVGPRVFPQLAGGVMVLMSLYLVSLTAWRRRRGTINDEILEVPYQNLLRVATVCFLSAGYMLAFNEFGFLVTTTTLLFLMFVSLGVRRYVLAVALALGFTVAIYLAFTGGLGLPLPDPILGGLL